MEPSFPTPSSIANQLAIVTGAGRGIGRKVVERLAQDGARVIAIDRDREPLEELHRDLPDLTIHPLDITDREGIEHFLNTLPETPPPSILVHCAGITQDALIQKMTPEQYRTVLKINLVGAHLFSEAVIRRMVIHRYGRVVHFSSRAYLGNFGQANYTASKGGIVGLTRAQALRYSSYGITVNAVAPGFVRTRLTEAIPPDVQARLISAIPVGFPGEPEDIAHIVRALVDPGARFITGQTILICGGRSLSPPPLPGR